MRRLSLALLLMMGCDSPSSMMKPFHRDGGLQFDDSDLSGPATAQDLAMSSTSDLAGAVMHDLAMSGGGCAAALATASWSFESGAQGFTHDAIDGFAGDNSWPFDEWDVGTPSGSGPGACHGGTKCFGTYLTGNYAMCERAELLSPVVDLSSCAGASVKLTFYHWFNFWTGIYGGKTYYDGGLVDLSGDGGNSWAASGASYPGTLAINPKETSSYECDSPNSFEVNAQMGYVGSSSGWVAVTIDLPAAAITSQFRARFAYSTGVSAEESDPDAERSYTEPGWYIDDVALTQ